MEQLLHALLCARPPIQGAHDEPSIAEEESPQSRKGTLTILSVRCDHISQRNRFIERSARRATDEHRDDEDTYSEDVDGNRPPRVESPSAAGEGLDFYEGLFSFGEDAEQQFTGVRTYRGANSEAVKKAKRDLQPMQVERNGRGVGTLVPTIGRDCHPVARPQVKGQMIFGMSEQYADALASI